MLEKLKTYSTHIIVVLACLFCFFYGGRLEKAKADKRIAELERTYAEQRNEALEQAESIRKGQEEKYLAQIADLKRANADRAADVIRVRKQFAVRQSSGNTDLKQCNQRASRCEQLLSEAYELAAEGESLLGDRDARLKALQ